MNFGFVVSTELAAVVNSGYGDQLAQSRLEGIRAVTDKPIRYVIDTSSPPHRVLGNARLRREGAQIIAGAEAAARLTGDGDAMARSSETFPGL